MRPVNLIPKEERPGGQRPMRGGPLAYVIVGALALALIGVVVLVITGNQISERESEIVTIKAETKAAEAKAQRLAAYTEFHTIHEQRMATVTSLADSRFDWERVMRELALIVPGNVWLTNLAGTVTSSVAPEGAASIGIRAGVPGPALEMVGCGRNQDAVAGFVQALKQIDGVTRVGLQISSRGATSGESSESTSTCQTKPFITQFQIVVAFDAAPIPQVAGGEEGEVPAPAPAPEGSSEEGESATASSSEAPEGSEG